MANKVIEAGSASRPGGYSFAKQQARRDKRRDAAETRQSKYDLLTTKQKLQRAQSRGGSKKEIAKLEARLEAEKLVKKVESPKIQMPPSTEKVTETKPKNKYRQKKASKAS